MNFDQLVAIYNKEQTEMDKAITEFPWKNRDAYQEWLANTYQYAVNSTRILALAGGLMPRHLTQFSNRFITHAAEEKGHDKLVLHDLKIMGRDLASIPITDEMQLFHHSLYYWLSPMGSPLGIFGFVIALESFPAKHGKWIYRDIVETYGAPACTFVKVHANEDPDHLTKALETVKNLSPEEMAVVAQSIVQYSRQFVRFMAAISCKYQTRKAA